MGICQVLLPQIVPFLGRVWAIKLLRLRHHKGTIKDLRGVTINLGWVDNRPKPGLVLAATKSSDSTEPPLGGPRSLKRKSCAHDLRSFPRRRTKQNPPDPPSFYEHASLNEYGSDFDYASLFMPRLFVASMRID